jgi:hypothetical protein
VGVPAVGDITALLSPLSFRMTEIESWLPSR